MDTSSNIQPDPPLEVRKSNSSAANSTVVNKHIFNDDLLINEDRDRGMTDREWAKQQFPEIFHVLYYRRLQEKFKAYNDWAERKRDHVRTLGIIAVISATLALLAVATEPVWPESAWTPCVALILELGGVAGTLAAVAWMWPLKAQWLRARLMAERIRQWHFQLMVRRGAAVEASCKPGGQTDFKTQRDIWFDNFLRQNEGKLDAKLDKLVGMDAYEETWLHEATAEYSGDSPVFRHICEAFKELRFDHQANFATLKLRTEREEPLLAFTKWPAIHQMKVLSASSGFCFGCALLCSLALIYSYATQILERGFHPGFSPSPQHYVRAAAIAIAIIGASLRTVQEGFAPDKEIERYEDYRSRTSYLSNHYKTSTDPKVRLHLMEELERASVDELRGFLRTHHNANFVLA